MYLTLDEEKQIVTEQTNFKKTLGDMKYLNYGKLHIIGTSIYFTAKAFVQQETLP